MGRADSDTAAVHDLAAPLDRWRHAGQLPVPDVAFAHPGYATFGRGEPTAYIHVIAWANSLFRLSLTNRRGTSNFAHAAARYSVPCGRIHPEIDKFHGLSQDAYRI